MDCRRLPHVALVQGSSRGLRFGLCSAAPILYFPITMVPNFGGAKSSFEMTASIAAGTVAQSSGSDASGLATKIPRLWPSGRRRVTWPQLAEG